MVALLAIAPAASAQYTPGEAITVSDTTVAPGESVTVTASGFAPGSEVAFTLESTPINLGTATANADGVATLTFTVPANVSAGQHTIWARGTGADGSPLALSTVITVTAAGTTTTTAKSTTGGSTGGSGTLPRTGSDNTALIRAGVVLLAVGGIAALVARKRTQVKA